MGRKGEREGEKEEGLKATHGGLQLAPRRGGGPPGRHGHPCWAEDGGRQAGVAEKRGPELPSWG